MREVVTRVWCDVCAKESLWNEGEEVPAVVIGTLKPRVVALCEPHRKELFDPFQEVLTDLGQIVPDALMGGSPRKGVGGRPSVEQLTCPACGHVSPNKSALTSHTKNMHDASIEELRGEPLPYECPECQRKFGRPQGMAAHRRTVHGVPGQDVHANASKVKAGKKAASRKTASSAK